MTIPGRHRFHFLIWLAAWLIPWSGTPLLRAQGGRAAMKKMLLEREARYCDYRRERKDLTRGAFEVLRFPTGWTFQPRYKHDPKRKSRILNPDYYCTLCVAEGRIPDPGNRSSVRLAQRKEEDVLRWIREELKIRKPAYLEDDSFKIFLDLPAMSTKRYPNRFLREELEQLHDVFPKISKKTTGLNPHQRLHLYRIRAHRLLRDFWWLAGTTEEELRARYPHMAGPYMGMKNKQEIFVFRKRKHFNRFLQWSIGVRTEAEGFCWHHHIDRAMMMVMFDSGERDPSTQNFFLHRLMHNLVDAYRTYQYKLPAWIQMGIAHWVERRETPRANAFCFSEGTTPEKMLETRWLPKVRKMVLKGDVPPLAQFAGVTEYGELPLSYHMVTYSLFSYLMSLGPEKFPVFLNILKEKRKGESLQSLQLRAFKKAYGLDLIRFDQGWREWVKLIYPSV